jgi:5-(carboxyamino)imidazole ribonucleotide synthase
MYTLKVGILGGGQLARMLAQSAQKMGLLVYVLCPKKTDPAAQVTSFWIRGNPKKVSDVIRFINSVDLVTFESENIPAEKIEESKFQAKIFPNLQALSLLRQRSLQKGLLEDFFIPTSKFLNIKTKKDLMVASKLIKFPMVLKKNTGAYDGKGTYFINSASDLAKFRVSENYIAEEKIAFKSEMAITLVRNQRGEIKSLPLVETKQINKRCDWVAGPYHHKDLKNLIPKIKSLLTHVEYVGVITFELFDFKNKLYVNEVAPRVHNSAHHSQDSCIYSQFDLHWIAGLGKQLPKYNFINKKFSMLNLIGQKKPLLVSQLISDFSDVASFHWYCKIQKPGRKLGHVNSLSTPLKELLKIRQNAIE